MKKSWRYLTAIVVLLLMNPETIELAVVVNSIGLDVFLMLVQIQILISLSFVTTSLPFSRLKVWGRRIHTLMLYQNPQALFMNALVLSVLFSAVLRLVCLQ